MPQPGGPISIPGGPIMPGGGPMPGGSSIMPGGGPMHGGGGPMPGICMGPPFLAGSCLLFSAKSTRIFEPPMDSPESFTARSTAWPSTNSTWQNREPPLEPVPIRTSLMSPQRSKTERTISSVASSGKPPIQTV